jgi:hypothetical protein
MVISRVLVGRRFAMLQELASAGFFLHCKGLLVAVSGP